MAMRVGDFYEFYGEDAETAARALEITLTGREDGGNGRVAMAGVPFHSVERYLARLVQQGFKVALCDQMEDPKQAKGLVRRSVTRVLTPGTVLEDAMLQSGRNNFLAAVCVVDGKAGLATLDPSTGEFLVTELADDGLVEAILQELSRIHPSELLLPEPLADLGEPIRSAIGASVTHAPVPRLEFAARALERQFSVRSLSGFGVEDKPSAILAAAMVLAYARSNGLDLTHVDALSTYSARDFMVLDPATRRSLELTQNLGDGGRTYSLLAILERTVTAMGARLLRRWVEQPLLDQERIVSRHEAVERLVTQPVARGDLRDTLKKIGDVERLVGRVATGLATPRDLASLRSSLLALPALEQPLLKLAFGRIQEVRQNVLDHAELAALLERAIVPDPPHSLRDGGVIQPEYDLELDKLRDLNRSGKRYIAALEQSERRETGISSLKVGYNSVFGYFLEVPKRDASRVPEPYIRKQTTAGAERYITAELKDHEAAVLGAEQKAAALEADLFARIRSRVAEQAHALRQTAAALAELDTLASLAEVALERRFTRPEMTGENAIEVRRGRHPIVEANTQGFVPNDTDIGEDGVRLIVLTGPNMSGKSTYLRQTALIVLLAQIGSFVPADSARLGICDRIFARIGAKDELAVGQSTFMVEMIESANILNHATERSMVILDEVGRGTSTFDGLAIAWAMTERLAQIGAKTMFATHYHQLNALAEQVPSIANFRVAVEEIGDEIVWTHRVLAGGADRSYGIHVARMAGMPRTVLERSTEILDELERSDSAPKAVSSVNKLQLTLFEPQESPVVKELQHLDLEALTPLEALRILDAWKRKFLSE